MAGIKHAKVSAKADDPDTSEVNPSDWNADHTITGDVPFNAHKATGLADPTLAQDAATKNYVDTHSGGGGVGPGTPNFLIKFGTTTTGTDSSVIDTGTVLTTESALQLGGQLTLFDNSGTIQLAPSSGLDVALDFKQPAQAEWKLQQLAGTDPLKLTRVGVGDATSWDTSGNLSQLQNLSVTGATKVGNFSGTPITVSISSATLNNWAPTGNANCDSVFINATGTSTVTGFVGGVDGRRLTFFNTGSGEVGFANASGASTAGNRFNLGGPTTLIANAGYSISFIYNSATGFWSEVGFAGVPYTEGAGVSFTKSIASSGGSVSGQSILTNGGTATWSGGALATLSPNGVVSGSPGDMFSQSGQTGFPNVFDKIMGSASTGGWIRTGSPVRKTQYEWRPAPGLTTWVDSSGNAPTAAGTVTLRSSGTTLYSGMNKVGYVSATAASSSAGIRAPQSQYCWMGNAVDLGGFYYSCRFGVSDAVLVTTASMFVGIGDRASSGVVNSPATLTNIVGVGCDSGDTTLQVYGAGGAAQTRTSLGAGFPVNGTVSTTPFELILYSAPNSQTVQYQVNNVNNGATASGSLATVRVPAATLGLCPILWRCNGSAGATAVGIDLFKMYLETES